MLIFFLISAILVVVLLSFVCKAAFLAIPDYQNAFIAAGQINAILQRNPIIDSQSTVGQELVCLMRFELIILIIFGNIFRMSVKVISLLKNSISLTLLVLKYLYCKTLIFILNQVRH